MVRRYNPTILRCWRILRRMEIITSKGILISFLFWAIFLGASFYMYNKVMLQIDKAQRFDHSHVMKIAEAFRWRHNISDAYREGGRIYVQKIVDNVHKNNSYVGRFINKVVPGHHAAIKQSVQGLTNKYLRKEQ